jgi:hypothetical protein
MATESSGVVTPVVQASPTSRAPATKTPPPSAFKYEAPVLREPTTGGRLSWEQTRVFEWEPVAGLAADEHYRIDFDRRPKTEGQDPYGDWVLTKEPEFVFRSSFAAPFHPPASQGEADLFWWVSVVRKTGEDQNGKPVVVDLSPPSERWMLTIEPKPDDA